MGVSSIRRDDDGDNILDDKSFVNKMRTLYASYEVDVGRCYLYTHVACTYKLILLD